MNPYHFDKVRSGDGFIAALDQSGGSTPKALEAYGIPPMAYSSDAEMFALMHEMRARIISNPHFGGERILGTILFEDTMDRTVDGQPSVQYLWNVKHVVPFLKIDKGLADEADGAQLMNPMPDLGAVLARARNNNIFGTKMRSVITRADDAGVKDATAQQFAIARKIVAAGLVPIIEIEVDIGSPTKAEAEALLKVAILTQLAQLDSGERVMLKLTLPEIDNFNAELMDHPNVVRLVALSGGYSQREANARLARNHGVVASFSRALTENLSIRQSDQDFDVTLDESIGAIFEASAT